MLAEAIAKAIKEKLNELERNNQGDIQECKGVKI